MTDTPSPLTPPAAAGSLALSPPEPVAAVAPEKVAGMVTVDPAAVPGLDAKVQAYVDGIVDLDVHSPAFSAKAADVRTMGDAEIRASAETSNHLLNAPVRAMKQGGLSATSKVSETLVDLRRTVEDLDPSEATGVKKLLGIIPFGDKIRDYFHRYESAQSHLDAIIKALRNGQDELLKDNAALEQEKVHLWETLQRLAQYVYIADHLDAALAARITEMDATDPDRAKVLRDDVLFYVRQKHQDLLTQTAVAIQGYLAIDLVRKNNLELVKGVDRATTTTVAALRTAVIVAAALADQKLVLDQIDALNTTTSKMIESTSALLASQSVDIHREAASSTVRIESLQAAFANIYQAMDAVDAYKAEALDAMATTVTALETEIDKAQTYLARVRQADERTQSGSLDLDQPPA
ncbi:MAG: toxic anion resistance protein [Actinomycetia bacterium]|nr:toxic anion resistance protein [Actinomycetes bacterium]